MGRTAIAKVGRASSGLCSLLRKRILSGRLTGGDYLPTVRELCAEHGLTIDTVCRALRSLEAEGLVVAEPRRGYRVLARANDPDRGCPLAFILKGPRAAWNTVDQMLLSMVQRVAAEQGRSVLAVGLGDQPPAAVAGQLRAARAWGAVLDVADPELVELLAASGVPAVLVDAWHEGLDVDAVVQDGFRGAMLAAAHLAERGHRRIGWLGYPLAGSSPQIVERFCGAMGGLARAGRELAGDLRAEVTPDDYPAALEGARRLLSGPDRPTAVLALWQPLVRAVVQAATELGLVPGRDVEMVGWWTEEEYETSYRPIFGAGPVPPAVTWSVTTMAEIAVARLEERRTRRNLPTIHLRIPTRLRSMTEDRR